MSKQNKTRQDKPLVELTEDQLKAIAGGDYSDECSLVGNCGVNHNETMFVFGQLKFEGGTDG